MISILTLLTACNNSTQTETNTNQNTDSITTEQITLDNITNIQLSNETITVNDDTISSNPENAVYVANDIVFYLEGQDIVHFIRSFSFITSNEDNSK